LTKRLKRFTVVNVEIGDYIKALREQRGLSPADLARLSVISPAHISLLEKNKRKNIRHDTAIKLCRAFEISVAEFYEGFKSNNTSESNKVIKRPQDIAKRFLKEVDALMCTQVPIRGSVPAGIPTVKEESIEGYIAVAKDELVTTRKDIYALRVCGESLEGDNIHDGDLLIIEPDSDIIANKIYILRLGDEVVARHVLQEKGGLKLIASNGSYQIIEVTEAEILGRVILAGRWQKF
jgi:repressor LexA